jgi:hypothetical protein
MKIGHNEWASINLENNSPGNITSPFAFETTATPAVMSFDDAADYTAQLVADKYANLHLCLSGGLDSEFVAKVLVRNSIAFTPVIVAADYVESENWYAYKFCQDNNLTPLVLDFSGKEKHTELVKMLIAHAHKHCLPFDRSLIVNIVADLLPNACVLTGYGDPVHVSSTFYEPIGDLVELTDHDYFLDVVHGSKHPGAFFSYTPELFAALVRELDTTKNTQIAKADLYGILCRSKIQSSFFNFYQLPELEFIIKKSLSKLGKNPEHQAFFINRDTLLNKFSGL